jgi:hypothetical protein
MGPAGVDNYITAFEMHVFQDAVAGACQMLAGVGTHQSGIIGVEVNHGVLQGQLRQGFAYNIQNHQRLCRDCLVTDLAGDFEGESEEIISHGLLELGNACLKA